MNLNSGKDVRSPPPYSLWSFAISSAKAFSYSEPASTSPPVPLEEEDKDQLSVKYHLIFSQVQCILSPWHSLLNHQMSYLFSNSHESCFIYFSAVVGRVVYKFQVFWEWATSSPSIFCMFSRIKSWSITWAEKLSPTYTVLLPQRLTREHYMYKSPANSPNKCTTSSCLNVFLKLQWKITEPLLKINYINDPYCQANSHCNLM